MSLTDAQFNRLRRLALEVAGIELFERHREGVVRRARRVGKADASTFDALLDCVDDGDAEARQQLLRLLTTKFTGFFRNPRHFEIAVQHALKTVHCRGSARLWSAAAATGEEPYSIAMALAEASDAEPLPVSILATDIEEQALLTAAKGEYSEFALRGVKPARREAFFVPSETANSWSVTGAIRKMVKFRALNLVSPNWAFDGKFDVIFCRNVLMYMEASRRCSVFLRIASFLAPDGLLMLDPAEHPGKAAELFSPVSDGVYRRNLSSSTFALGEAGPRLSVCQSN